MGRRCAVRKSLGHPLDDDNLRYTLGALPVEGFNSGDTAYVRCRRYERLKLCTHLIITMDNNPMLLELS